MKKRTKKRIVITELMLIMTLTLSSLQYVNAAEQVGNAAPSNSFNFEEQYKTGMLSLSLNKTTGEVCLRDQSTGAVWYSNPQDKENDTVAVGVNKMNLFSTFVLNYRDVARKVAETTNSYTGSVSENNIKIKKNKNGFTVYYKFNAIRTIVPLKYELTKDCLKCTVLTKEIVESEDYPLLSISLLPYFGAGGAKDDGYLLIPDGSGALINFNNGKANFGAYSQKVYGHDENIQLSSKAAYNQSAKLPVFGIKNNGNGLLAIIEEGEATATINAAPGGKSSSYNAANATFSLRTVDTYALGESTGGTTTDITIIEEKKLGGGNLTVAFYPLEKGNSDYPGMAQKYKQHLMDEYGLAVRKDRASVNLETVASVRVQKYLFGVPYNKTVVLTDLEAMKRITDDLEKKGVGSVDVMYSNWTKDELNNAPMDNAKVLSALGGKSALKTLVKEWENGSDKIYLSSDFYKVKKWPGFANRNNSSIMSISEKPVVCYDYSFLSYFKNYTSPVSFIISMNKVEKYVKRFGRSFSKLPDGVNISIGEIANKVPSDYTEKGWSRQDSVKVYENIIKGFSKNNDVMAEGGNKYALSGADIIINADSKSSEYNYADDSVPFYQLVVSGLTEYSYRPMNLSSDIDAMFLKSVETGANLCFFLIDKNADVLNDAGYSSFFSVVASDWIGTIAEYSKKIQKISQKTEGSPLVDHRKIQDNVYQSVWENGYTVITNYNENSITVGDTTVDAMDYAEKEGGIVQ